MSRKLSVSLEDKHIRAVERYGREIGVKQFSTALQALIHQFEQARKAQQVIAVSAQAQSEQQPA